MSQSFEPYLQTIWNRKNDILFDLNEEHNVQK